jgi:hypothetical protein
MLALSSQRQSIPRGYLLVSSLDEAVIAGEVTARKTMDMDPTNYLTRERERI